MVGEGDEYEPIAASEDGPGGTIDVEPGPGASWVKTGVTGE